MAEISIRQTAKIYQFPIARRMGVDVQRPRPQMSAELMPLPLPKAIYGEAWYHAAAIEEAALLPRKR